MSQTKSKVGDSVHFVLYGKSKLRSSIFLCLMLSLVYGESFAQLHNSQKNLPPITNQTKDADKPMVDPQPQQAQSISFPSTINLVVSGSLNQEGQIHGFKSTDEPINWSEWVIALLTGLLVLVTGYLVLYTKRLWGATNQLVTDAKDTSERQLRAYVHITNAHITPYEEIGSGPITAYIYFQNAGQTPAYQVRNWIGVYPDKLANDKFIPVNPDKEPGAESVMGPGVQSHFVISTTCHVPDDVYQKMCNGERAFYVYGEIVYLDAFGVERVTKYKFRTTKDSIKLGLLGPCEDGNYAD